MRWLHRALGLTAGVVLVVSGLTGSALVFRQEIDTALNPHLLRVAPAAATFPLQLVLDEVRHRYPDAAPTRVRMPQRRDGTYEFWLGVAPERYVYADPYRGTLLGTRRPREFLTGWLFLLHSHLLSGDLGEKAAGACALALVLLSTSGLVLWWPRRAPWRGAWARWRASLTAAREAGAKRLAYDLHRAVGFYASALLLVAGLTGASLVFHEAFERAAYLLTGTTPAPLPAPLPAPSPLQPSLPLDTLLAIAERAQPGGIASYLYLPAGPRQAFRVRKRLPGEAHPNGKSFVHVEPATGRVLAVEDGARAPRGARLYSLLYPLHTGVLGGPGTRVLAVATGLSLSVVAFTGVLMWWRRRKGRRRRAS